MYIVKLSLARGGSSFAKRWQASVGERCLTKRKASKLHDQMRPHQAYTCVSDRMGSRTFLCVSFFGVRQSVQVRVFSNYFWAPLPKAHGRHAHKHKSDECDDEVPVLHEARKSSTHEGKSTKENTLLPCLMSPLLQDGAVQGRACVVETISSLLSSSGKVLCKCGSARNRSERGCVLGSHRRFVTCRIYFVLRLLHELFLDFSGLLYTLEVPHRKRCW